MNYSKQREIILSYLRSVDTHPTAETIYEAIRAQCPNVSLATVYRNLNQLADNNYISRIKIDGKSDRYDSNTTVHSHLYCRNCGKIFDMPSIYEPGEMFGKVREKTGFSAESCQMMFIGKCTDCMEK